MLVVGASTAPAPPPATGLLGFLNSSEGHCTIHCATRPAHAAYRSEPRRRPCFRGPRLSPSGPGLSRRADSAGWRRGWAVERLIHPLTPAEKPAQVALIARGSGSAAGVVEHAEAVLVEPLHVDRAGRLVARQLLVSQPAAEHQYAVVPHPFRRPERVGLPFELAGVGEQGSGSGRAPPVDSLGR